MCGSTMFEVGRSRVPLLLVWFFFTSMSEVGRSRVPLRDLDLVWFFAHANREPILVGYILYIYIYIFFVFRSSFFTDFRVPCSRTLGPARHVTLSEHTAAAWPTNDSVSYTTTLHDHSEASIYWCLLLILVLQVIFYCGQLGMH